MDPGKETQFVIDLARQAGAILMEYFGTELKRNIKTGPSDYATEADIAAEKVILEQIKTAFPRDAIIAEESGKYGSKYAQYTWIVDPLDGTHHFANNSKDFAVMISRAHGQLLELAVIYNPAKGILAWGEVGKGTYLQGSRIDLTAHNLAGKPLSVERDAQEQLKGVGIDMMNEGASTNTLACLAGERQAYVSSNGYDWDFAPAIVMLVESGWKATDIYGNAYRWSGALKYGQPGVISAPEHLHQELVIAMDS